VPGADAAGTIAPRSVPDRIASGASRTIRASAIGSCIAAASRSVRPGSNRAPRWPREPHQSVRAPRRPRGPHVRDRIAPRNPHDPRPRHRWRQPARSGSFAAASAARAASM